MRLLGETNIGHLLSFGPRYVAHALISLTFAGLASLSGAQDVTPKSLASPAAAPTRDQRIHNIVLVHGAWADGSGWRSVYDILIREGLVVLDLSHRAAERGIGVCNTVKVKRVDRKNEVLRGSDWV